MTTLTPEHLAQLREGSGISDEVIAARGYRSSGSVDGYVELKRLGFTQVKAKNLPGLLLPLWTTDGQQSLTIYRPDTPRLDRDGKPIKYETPKGASLRLDCPPPCQPLLADPTVPLWVTEGQKKADALASCGACTIALLGVYGWRGKNSLGGVTGLADFEDIALKGREVRLVFDSDLLTKPEVRRALDRFSKFLTNRQATVRTAYLSNDHGQKVGVDDYLVAGHSLADLEALLEAPRPQPQPAPALVELLEEAPACLRRPLTLVQGRTYAAIWPHVKVTHTEGRDKDGNIVKFAAPEVTTEQRLLIVRDDGATFGDGGDKPLHELEMAVHLPEIPRPQQLWTVPAVNAYRVGKRPDAGATFQQVVSVVDRFIDFDRSLASQHVMCELVASYIVMTWFLDAFPVVGYLWPNGERGSGKTQLLTVVAELTYLGHVILAGGSYASLRDLADYGATLGFDDAETVMDVKRGDPDKRALLLAGNRRGNTIPIKEPVNGRQWRTRHVNTFCPRLFSAIRLPDPVLASRTIIIPLIRTANRDKANADPLDSRLWPIPRAPLVNDLWALALANCSIMPSHDAYVADNGALLGRSLEPWRAVLGVAHWLTACGVTDLYSRMEALSLAYQKERPDLEPADLTALTICALLHYSVSSVSSISAESPEGAEIVFETATITDHARSIATDHEIGLNPDDLSTRRIGRILSKLRFQEKPRSGSGGKRQWQCTKGDLRRWLVSYGIPLPETLFPEGDSPYANGANGGNGANGASEEPAEEVAEWTA